MEVIISGNERTNDHVIRRELSTIPGQNQKVRLIRTQQMLRKCDISRRKLRKISAPTLSDGTVDIEWSRRTAKRTRYELSEAGEAIWIRRYGGPGINNFSARIFCIPRNGGPLPVGDGQKLARPAQANDVL